MKKKNYPPQHKKEMLPTTTNARKFDGGYKYLAEHELLAIMY